MAALWCGQYTGRYQAVEDLVQVASLFAHNKLLNSDVYLTFDHIFPRNTKRCTQDRRTSAVDGD